MAHYTALPLATLTLTALCRPRKPATVIAGFLGSGLFTLPKPWGMVINIAAIAYLISGVLFILALRGLSPG